MKVIYSLIIISFNLITSLCFSTSDVNKKPVYIVELSNEIISTEIGNFVERAIDEAIKNNASCIILKLDTPGGMLEATRNLVKKILKDDIIFITYVTPSGGRAASAGVFISLASHVLCMTPGTNMGAAHPILRADENNIPTKDEILEKKILNDTVSWIQTIAETRKRNAEWAVLAVKDSISDSSEKLLDINIADISAIDMNELYIQLKNHEILFRGQKVFLDLVNSQEVIVKPTLKERILGFLLDPRIVIFFIMLAVGGFIYEIFTAGHGPGIIVGVLCLLLGMPAFNAIPINIVGLGLIIIGIVFFLLELKITSFGLLTIGGSVSLGIGLIMLYDTPDSLFKLELNYIIPLVAVLVLITSIILIAVYRVFKRRPKGFQDTLSIIGTKGIAITDITTKGKVSVKNEIWNAECDNHISKDSKIKVISADGFLLKVIIDE